MRRVVSSYDWRIAVFNEMHRELKNSARSLDIIERDCLLLSRKLSEQDWNRLKHLYGSDDLKFVRKWLFKLGFMEVLP